MKNYLKKCKSTANSLIQQARSGEPREGAAEADFRQRRAVEEAMPLTSWYVTDEFYSDEEPRNHVTVVQIRDVARDGVVKRAECEGAVADVSAARVEGDATIVRLGEPPGEEAESLEHFVGAPGDAKRCCDLSVSANTALFYRHLSYRMVEAEPLIGMWKRTVRP